MKSRRRVNSTVRRFKKLADGSDNFSPLGDRAQYELNRTAESPKVDMGVIKQCVVVLSWRSLPNQRGINKNVAAWFAVSSHCCSFGGVGASDHSITLV